MSADAPTAEDFETAAALLERLPRLVEEATAAAELSPAELAREAGIPVANVLSLVDSPPSYRTPVRLLRWLARL